MNEEMTRIDVCEGEIVLVMHRFFLYAALVLMACGLGALWHVAVLCLSRLS